MRKIKEKILESFKWIRIGIGSRLSKRKVKRDIIQTAKNGTITYEYIRDLYSNLTQNREKTIKLKEAYESSYMIPDKQTCGFHIGNLEDDRIRIRISLICIFNDNTIRVEVIKLARSEYGDQQVVFNYDFIDALDEDHCTAKIKTYQKDKMIASTIKVIRKGFVNTIKLCW